MGSGSWSRLHKGVGKGGGMGSFHLSGGVKRENEVMWGIDCAEGWRVEREG